MSGLVILIGMLLVDDLRSLTIPAEAVERPGSFRPGRYVKKKRDYFVDGALIGSREFYTNGNVADERIYRGGKLHGIRRQYWMNGKLFAERPYRAGQMDGTFRFWDENGKPLGESEMKNGTGVLREFENLSVMSEDTEAHYVDGKKHGLRTLWGRFQGCTGIGYSISSYNHGKLEGWVVTRDEDGALVGYGYMKNGRLHGAALDVKRDGTPRTGFPKYYINGDEVAKERFLEAAKTDKILAETLTYSPPRTEKPPAHDKPRSEPTQTTAVGPRPKSSE